MALTAQLYRDDRGSERFSVAFDATLRDPSHLPVDVVVEDLSVGGFRMQTRAELAEGVEIGLGLAGIGMHRARVVWRDAGTYGCEFVTPLTSADVGVALGAPSSAPVVLPRLGPWGPVQVDTDPDERVVRKLPRPVRLLVIIVGAIACWIMVLGIGVVIRRALAL